jgi:hypothetical protein
VKNIDLNPGGLVGAIASGGITALVAYSYFDPGADAPARLFVYSVIGGAFAGNFLWSLVSRQTNARRHLHIGDARRHMVPEVTDVWFRSGLPLTEIARRLGLREVIDDAENYWAWVIGSLGNTRLDITRTHTRPADSVDTRIFVLDGKFTEPLLDELIGRLRALVPGVIWSGRWECRSGNDFDLVVVREFAPPE